jgi:hypothetical protein
MVFWAIGSRFTGTDPSSEKFKAKIALVTERYLGTALNWGLEG